MLTVVLNIPSKVIPRAKYVFRYFSSIWGLSVSFKNHVDHLNEPVITYGLQEGFLANGILIPFDASAYDSKLSLEKFLSHSKYTRSPDDFFRALTTMDFVGIAFRLLTLLDEKAIPKTYWDKKGTYLTTNLDSERIKFGSTPILDQMALHLQSLLEARWPNLKGSKLPVWPDNKKFALLVTHDCDASKLGAPLEIATNLAKTAISRDPKFLRLAYLGIMTGLKGDKDPYDHFSTWHSMGSDLGYKSSFFVSLRSKVAGRHLNDPKAIMDPNSSSWQTLRDIVRDGVEVGLHPGIKVKGKMRAFVELKQTLEEKLGTPVFGVRHHYLALDWRKPHVTFRKQVNAGFRYDASIAWRDIVIPKKNENPYSARN